MHIPHYTLCLIHEVAAPVQPENENRPHSNHLPHFPHQSAMSNYSPLPAVQQAIFSRLTGNGSTVDAHCGYKHTIR